jgi:hypothetical protein
MFIACKYRSARRAFQGMQDAYLARSGGRGRNAGKFSIEK